MVYLTFEEYNLSEFASINAQSTMCDVIVTSLTTQRFVHRTSVDSKNQLQPGYLKGWGAHWKVRKNILKIHNVKTLRCFKIMFSVKHTPKAIYC